MSQIRPVLTRLLHFEDALQKTGWGLYYKFLVYFSAANLFTNGFVLLCVHFAVPLSACDTVLEETDVVSIYVCFVIGRAIGGYIFCSIADNNGKKCMIPKSLMIIFASCFISAFSHNMYTLYFAAFFLGSGLQTNIACVKIYLAEILPPDKRGFYIVLPDLFWTAGYFSTSVFIYYFGTTSTTIAQHQIMDMKLTSWRIIFAIGGGLCITMACTSALLELGPRYLLFKRRIITASLILKQFYAINRSKYSETFEIHSQQLLDLVSDFNINIDPEPLGMVQILVVASKVMFRMLRIILRKPFLKLTIIITLIKMPTLFGIPGTAIYFSHLWDNTNDSVLGSDLIYLKLLSRGNCTVSFEENQFQNFLLISLNILFGQLMLLWIIDKIGRKFPIFAGLVTCAITNIILAFTESFALLAVGTSLNIFSLTIIESTVYVVVIESFPTAVRGTALGVVQFYALIVSCFFYSFLNSSRQVFLTFLAATMFGTSILACFIPEMKGRPMVE